MPSLQRYGGEALPDSPHIVVLGSCKVGNFVVSTPVLQGLKARFPGAVIGFVGREITVEFEAAHPAIDWRHSWGGVNHKDFHGASYSDLGPVRMLPRSCLQQLF